MANINKIRLSGQTYNIEDANASKTVELTQAQYDALTVKDPNTFYIITDAQGADLSNYYTKSETSGATEISTALNAKADTATTYTKTETDNAITAATSTKQDTLVSGTNIKTINNESILGSGNINIQGGGGKAVSGGTNISITTGETADTINCTLSGGTLINIANNKINCQAPIKYGTGSNSIIVGSSISTNKATGINSIANGGDANTASGQYSYAEGYYTTAATHSSHSEGWFTKANGQHSHSEGNHTVTNKDDSHAEGKYTVTNNVSEHASGQYNVSSSASTTWGDSGNTLFSVGNGTADNARHNAFEIRQNGDIYLTKDGQDVKLQDHLGGGGGGITSGEVQTMIDESVSGKANSSDSTYSVNANIQNDGIYFTTLNKDGNQIDYSFEPQIRFQAPLYSDYNDGKVKISGVTAVTSASTDSEIPTAKAVNDKLGGLSLVKLTQAEYDNLATKDNSTLYVIVN